jgi:shikimate kinase
MTRVAHIDGFIREYGYERYMEANSGLAHSLVDLSARPLVLVLSSGFMMTDSAPSYGERNRGLVRETGYSILMAPSADIDEATEITVARQLARGLGLEADRESAKFRSRFPAYSQLGDMQVFSFAPPDKIASAIAGRFKHRSDH